MKTISITAVQEDVDASTPGSRRDTALWYALLNHGYFDAEIDDEVWYPHGDPGPCYPLPEDAKQFTRDIDAGKPVVVPATFKLPLEVA